MATPKPSGTNCPRSSFRPPRRGREPRAGRAQKQARRRQARHPASPEHDAKPQAAAAREPHASHTQSGGYGGGVPPLPIPNREVKPARADGTAHECGRVGCRPLQTSRPPADSSAGGRFFAPPPPRRSPLLEPFAAQKRAPADGLLTVPLSVLHPFRHVPLALMRFCVHRSFCAIVTLSVKCQLLRSLSFF